MSIAANCAVIKSEINRGISGMERFNECKWGIETSFNFQLGFGWSAAHYYLHFMNNHWLGQRCS